MNTRTEKGREHFKLGNLFFFSRQFAFVIAHNSCSDELQLCAVVFRRNTGKAAVSKHNNVKLQLPFAQRDLMNLCNVKL